MLPVPAKGVTKAQAFVFMQSYLALIGIPFRAAYLEGVPSYIRVYNSPPCDEKILKDIKGLCCQLGGYFTYVDDDSDFPHLNLEWGALKL